MKTIKNNLNFYDLILDVLNEKGLTIKDLENVIAERAVYGFSKCTPSLQNAIKIANYLEISLDYLIGKTNVNKFKPYNSNQRNFFNILNKTLKEMNISQNKLSKDIHIGQSNFSRWKNSNTPRFSTIIEIANYLGCMIDDLLEH